MKDNRIKSILKKMEAEDIGQMLVTDPAAIYYLLDRWIHPGERLLALYLGLNKKPLFFINELFPLDDEVPVDKAWLKDTDDGIKVISNYLLDEGNIGIDKNWPAGFLLELMKGYVNCKFVNASYILDKNRSIKDGDEIQLMREASSLNDKAIKTLIENFNPDLSEKQMAKTLLEVYDTLGTSGPSFDPIIAYGKNAADPHHSPDETELKVGDSIIIDIGCSHKSYSSDMTRTIFYKSVSEEDRRVYDIVKTANQRAIDMIRPGVRFCDIDAAARNYIEEKGYGKYFNHRTGHSIGIEVHEAGDVSATNTSRVEAGMIFSIEPGIYLPNKVGVRIEDLVLVTEDGCEVLNNYTKELTIID
ncbi:M24 family metallopeptidase [Alkaliphilus serpentinus]|uniref:Aminopeptidase P family protein n=1 Tax=Alkaliphilus serpentinus TaxID=1482731 RepID=A0A833HPR9_9FIRM|nr:aminopeptidase P family protein [Alkaliphilus serpentinus]KAB3531112.1 aminopeptidase P family protein [Alkaliphilus serpentinus]